MDYVGSFVAGGLIVSAFAILGDLLRPKSFAGLFGAAPSIALATLTMAVFTKQRLCLNRRSFDVSRSRCPFPLLRRGLPAAYALPFFGGYGNRIVFVFMARPGPRLQTNPDRVTHDRSR
jgi:hypothetical protein